MQYTFAKATIEGISTRILLLKPSSSIEILSSISDKVFKSDLRKKGNLGKLKSKEKETLQALAYYFF